MTFVTNNNQETVLSGTWDNSAVAYTRLRLNVNDVSSASTSNLLDLQNNGVSQFKIEKNGGITFQGDSGLKAPGNIRIWSTGNASVIIRNSLNTFTRFNFDTAGGAFTMANGSNQSVILRTDTTDVLAQRNGTNAQKFRVYNTYGGSPEGSNFEALEIGHRLYSTSQFQYVSAITSGTGAANIGIAIVPAGTGAFTLAVPDGSATGGNARGTNAIDLQTLRTDNTGVAAGQESIVIGTRNKATGSWSLAMGNAATSQATRAISIGSYCGANATNSISIGISTAANGERSVALGNTSNATNYGSLSYSNGNFSFAGDFQSTKLLYRNSTSGVTETELYLNGSSSRAVIPYNTAWFCDIKVLGRQVSGVNHASYWRRCLIENTGGVVQMVSAVETLGTDVETDSNWNIAVTADDANNSLKIAVTGTADTNIRWMAEVNVLELNYGNS